MSINILDERDADRQVIATLVRELNRKDPMAQFYKLQDGSVIRVHGEVEAVSREELERLASQLQNDAELLRGFIIEEKPAAPEAPVAEPARPEPEEAEVVVPAPAAEPAAPVDKPSAEDVAVPAAAPEAVAPEAPAGPAINFQ